MNWFNRAIVFCLLASGQAAAQPPMAYEAGERRILLERLLVTGSALYIGAHPDDENTAMLAYLAQGRKVRTAYLSLTRGDGGQNLIGPEQGDLLGVIRTEELLAARRIDWGGEQFFTRAVDFGYSKTPEETLRIWGKERILGDVVWIIRSFRPDILITRFPTTGDGGHGHHTASALLAAEAFTAAGDAERFPEQLRYVAPWRARRLFWNAWVPSGQTQLPSLPGRLAVDLGSYNALLGRSYTEVAAASRSMHKSQGFGSPSRRGSWPNYLDLLAGDRASDDPFAGVDMTWGRLPGGDRVAEHIRAALARYADEHPSDAVPELLKALEALEQLPRDPIVERKRTELLEAIRACAGLWLEAIAETPLITRGSPAKVTVEAVKRSNLPVRIERVELPGGVPPVLSGSTLDDNRLLTASVSVPIAADAPLGNPYWLEGASHAGTYAVPDERLLGRPTNPPALEAAFQLSIEGRELTFKVPVLHRSTDPIEGERWRSVVVVPDVTVSLESPTLLFPAGEARRVRVIARANLPGASKVLRFEAGTGWRVDPGSTRVNLTSPGQEQTLWLTITPPAAEGTTTLVVKCGNGGDEPARTIVTIDHPHIPTQALLPVVSSRLVRVDVRSPARRIGYVMGAGDDIPAILRQLGVQVVLLEDADLEEGRLESFDAIVTGVRAFNTRPALARCVDALFDYVKGGGTLVVQYNTDRGLVTDRLAPYPLTVSRDRVTDETAAVKILDPSDPLLTAPHRIGAADFDGWVQERGLNFPDKWDDRLVPLLAMADPGQSPAKGALLVVRYGEGTYCYTGLSFFRQLPAGIPGAIRLFVNLLSQGARARG